MTHVEKISTWINADPFIKLGIENKISNVHVQMGISRSLMKWLTEELLRNEFLPSFSLSPGNFWHRLVHREPDCDAKQPLGSCSPPTSWLKFQKRQLPEMNQVEGSKTGTA